jgi:hypothetical protein
MKRLLLSFASGVLLPILYFFLIGLIVSVVKMFSDTAQGNGWWFLLLGLPLEWGGRLYNLLFPAQFENPFALLRGPVILSDVVGGFLFFAVLTYAFLWWRSTRMRPAHGVGPQPNESAGLERGSWVSHLD